MNTMVKARNIYDYSTIFLLSRKSENRKWFVKYNQLFMTIHDSNYINMVI